MTGRTRNVVEQGRSPDIRNSPWRRSQEAHEVEVGLNACTLVLRIWHSIRARRDVVPLRQVFVGKHQIRDPDFVDQGIG